MAKVDQVLRFAVGSPEGPRSRCWRIWVPRGRSDLYVSGRTLGNAVKVSLHEPGPARMALTKHWVKRTGFVSPSGKDARLAVEWKRPRPQPPNKIARPLSILIPHDEVLMRLRRETGSISWISQPSEGFCIHVDIVYVPSSADVSGHPGQRSMGTELVGRLWLANGEQVFVTAISRPIEQPLRNQIDRFRNTSILDKFGSQIDKIGLFAFGIEPNPDASDGTEIGVLIDITRAKKAEVGLP